MSASRYCRVLPRLGRQAVSTLFIASCLSSFAHSSHAVEPAAKATAASARQAVAPAADSVMQRNSKIPATKRDPSKSTLAQAAAEPAVAQKAQPRAKQKRKPTVEPPEVQPAPRADPRQAALLARQTADQIRELLLRARRAAGAGRSIEPSNENAAVLYREVLRLDPTQTEALAGVERLVAVLAKEVEFAAAAGNQARAQAYLTEIRSLQPKAGTVLELDARLQALDASPVVLSARQQDRYSLCAQSIDRARSYLDNQPLDLRTIKQALDEYDRAIALVPSAPGLPLLKERITVLFPEATRRELAADNSKRALKLVETARERGWSTAELAPLEAEVKATMRPGRYDTTFAECPDSVAQACKQSQSR